MPTNDASWRAPCKGGAFPVGINPARHPLQPEATGAATEVTKWLKPLGIVFVEPLVGSNSHGWEFGGLRLR